MVVTDDHDHDHRFLKSLIVWEMSDNPTLFYTRSLALEAIMGDHKTKQNKKKKGWESDVESTYPEMNNVW